MLIVDAINEAINNNRQISFTYFRYDCHKDRYLRHNGEPYVVMPLQLVWNGDYYYMVCFCEDKQQVSCFRIDRIAACLEILEESGSMAPEEFDVDQYINTSFRMSGGECREVELLCDNDVMDAIIDRFGTAVETIIYDDDRFRATVNVAVSHIFFSWVFGFCGKVHIKSLQEVQEQYKRMLCASGWQMDNNIYDVLRMQRDHAQALVDDGKQKLQNEQSFNEETARFLEAREQHRKEILDFARMQGLPIEEIMRNSSRKGENRSR